MQGAARLFPYFPATLRLAAAVSLLCSLLHLHPLSMQVSVCGAFAAQSLFLQAEQTLYLPQTKTSVSPARRLNFAVRAVLCPPAPL